MQSELSRWQFTRSGQTDAVDRQDAALVFVGEENRPSRRGLEESGAVKFVRIKADCRIVLPGAYSKVLVEISRSQQTNRSISTLNSLLKSDVTRTSPSTLM